MKLRKNLGVFDRIIRLLIAFILFVVAYWKMSWIVLILAVFVLFESCRGWCIFYQMAGKSSCAVSKKKRKRR